MNDRVIWEEGTVIDFDDSIATIGYFVPKSKRYRIHTGDHVLKLTLKEVDDAVFRTCKSILGTLTMYMRNKEILSNELIISDKRIQDTAHVACHFSIAKIYLRNFRLSQAQEEQN